MSLSTPRASLCLALALALGPACSESVSDDVMSPVGGSQLQLLLTDAPSDYIASAEVTVSRVYLQPNDGSAATVEMFQGSAPKTFDLMELRNGVQALLADSPVPARNYSQLRLVLDGATVTLADGYTFADGTTTRTLSVPSGSRTGIKVHLAGSIEAAEGRTIVLIVDFDVNQSFVMQGSATSPAGIRGFTFIPVITETDRSTS